MPRLQYHEFWSLNHIRSGDDVAPAKGRLSRREFLRVATLATGSALLPVGLMRASGEPVQPPIASPCLETVARIFDLAATAEALAMTFYYQAIVSEWFIRLPTSYQAYFRAALDQERAHYRYLVQNGAQPQVTQFYVFIRTIEVLETDFMGAYLAASRRFAEMGRPELAAIAGQIVGIEAEHRIIGRELVGNIDLPNNLCFERTTVDCVAQVVGVLSLYLNGGAGYEGPLPMPTDEEMTAAIQGVSCASVPTATATTCQETINDMLNIAATAEALGITFYYAGIRRGFFSASDRRQWYLQAALDEERNHLNFLTTKGATTPPTQFFFPARAFADLPVFLSVLETLENTFIGAYLAAMQRFAQLGLPLLAQTCGQILGVEAEHRLLGRIIEERSPANDQCLQPARYGCLGEAAAALTPFLQGSDTFIRQATLPTPTEIDQAVGRFGCTAVPTAAYRVYFPHLTHSPPRR
jgi:hypothetical protein